VHGWIDLGARHFEKVTTLKTLQKLNHCTWPFTNAYAIIIAQLVEQFRFARRRHSPYDVWHDSDPVESGFKLNPD
jgi:hypothetical protein